MDGIGRAWLSPKEVAVALGLSIYGVRALIRSGRLPARRLRGGRLLRVAREDLDGLLEPLPGGWRRGSTTGNGDQTAKEASGRG